MKLTQTFIRDLRIITNAKNLLINEPMANHTTFRVGGPADVFITPTNYCMLKSILTFLRERNLPIFIMGRGSNLIVSDKGIRGAVISTFKLNRIGFQGNSVLAGCGVDLGTLSHSVALRGLSGLEFACGIPGSVGGAVYMNAGAYEGEISRVLEKSSVLLYDDNSSSYQYKTLSLNDHAFSYRHSVFQEEALIHINSVFRLKPADAEEIISTINKFTRSREAKQPLDLPSAGSVFRRPQGYFTGQLIEECGLKGFRIGDAAVSNKHCGFIVNLGHATAENICSLITHVQNTIYDRCGVMLQTEVKFIGES